MGMFDFVKNAGQKLFGSKHEEEVAANPDEANMSASQAILDYITSQGLTASGLSVAFDGATSTVAVGGDCATTADKEKILLCAGNVSGVAAVTDNMTAPAGAEPRFYEVKSGDNLSHISKEMYGNPNHYQAIFEANKPMLEDMDEIYPGQNLRIPELAA